MKHSFSIRTALLLLVLIIIIILAITFSFLVDRTYNTLVLEHGESLMSAMEKSANDDLSDLLMDPQLANGLLAGLLEHDKYYDHEDYQVLEPLILDFMKRVTDSLPQVSAVGYGDAKKNYIGYRLNEDLTYGLMVKDKYTEALLNIYTGETRASDVIASYENYDPTSRPWYMPVLNNPVAQWSQVYVNYDEIQNTTITSIIPILDEKSNVMGVSGLDVNLNSINTFLRGITEKNKGVLYLVDREFKVIAHSTDEVLLTLTGEDPPLTEFAYAVDSENILISKSAGYLSEKKLLNSVQQVNFEDTSIYTMLTSIDPRIGLDWYFVVAVPEDDLIGTIQSEFYAMRMAVIIIGIVGLLIGGFLVNILISSILKLEKNLATVDMDHMTKEVFSPGRFDFIEVYNLKMAYMGMMEQLSDSFKSLNHSRNRYRSLIENSDAIVFSMTTDGIVLTYNSHLVEYIDDKRHTLVGASFYDLISEDTNRKTWEGIINEVVSSGQAYDGTYEYYDAINKRSVFKMKIIPVKNGDRVNMLIATLVNIIELIEAQEAVEELMLKEKEELELLVQERTKALEQAMEELVQKEKLASLGSLVSGISHEINTPLGVAVSVSSFLKTKAKEGKDKLLNAEMTKSQFEKYIEQLVESTDIIEENLVRANDLIKSFKQISVDKTYAHTINFNVALTIESTIKSLHHELKQNGHEIIVECPDEISMFGDPGSFSQVITNLVLNSILHGYDGQEGLMRIEVESDENELTMTYLDNGVGIEEENLTKIFDPFFTTNRKKGGSGLGLNIVYNIVTVQFGGSIHVESDKSGTKFIFKFPHQS
ncbi:hypothetical protein EZV73_20355 [Acidaminobacter sp. JC074]|uniref:ATP-binding protein n=1 Tax=Acidaminobacter sp. JC074 TaxID=2530199 RepID=UPI001F10D5F8|nr:ATP-binding protein [Acidaminobacter sp. JC074]MCH4889944.1 hypothetical protein [Acidaminobacter sp. JC074]